MGLEIKCYPYGMYAENTYLITDEATGLMAIIDPGYFGADVKKDIQNSANLQYMLLTHGHHDHLAAASEIAKTYNNVCFAVPEKDMIVINSQPCSIPYPEKLLKEGDIITLGETELRVIETPGHTAGGICFATDELIFTGDTLFKLSVGRTDLFTGDWDALQDSIKSKLYTLDENMTVYPGHGVPTTIGFEKRANPFV